MNINEQPGNLTPFCPIHNQPMVLRTGQYGQFWSCGQKDQFGQWCKYKPEKDPHSPFYKPPQPKNYPKPYPVQNALGETQNQPQPSPINLAPLERMAASVDAIRTILERWDLDQINEKLGVKKNPPIPVIEE